MNELANFELHLQFFVPTESVFTALTTLNGIKNWWTQFCEVSEVVGGQSSFYFPADGFYAVMKTIRLQSPRLLEWECVDSKHSENTGFTDLHDWIGTRIRFEVKDLGNGKSQLDFTHFRLNQLECHDVCSSGWSFFLNESLRGYLEHGNNEVGQGRVEIIESSPLSKVIIKIDFIKPFKGHNTIEFLLVPQGDTTTVTQAMYGSSPYISKVMCLFFSMDKMVGSKHLSTFELIIRSPFDNDSRTFTHLYTPQTQGDNYAFLTTNTYRFHYPTDGIRCQRKRSESETTHGSAGDDGALYEAGHARRAS